jgi:ferrous iron transport protein A
MANILGDLSIGDTGRVTALRRGDRAYREKLMAMGVLPGAELTVVRLAPLGDPVEITIRGSQLSLRKDEAAMVEVERIDA